MIHQHVNHSLRSWLLVIVMLSLVGLLVACAPQNAEPQPPDNSSEATLLEEGQVAGASQAPDETQPAADPTNEPADKPTDEPAVEPTVEPQPTAVAVPPLAVVNGLLIDGSGADPIADAALVIENGQITAVGPAAVIEVPENAEIVDAHGGTILPGVVEGRASDLLNELRFEDGAINEFDAEVYLYRALRAGVTTVRATGLEWEAQQNLPALRAALAAMGNTVPTIVISGTAISHGEGAGVTQYYLHQLVGVDNAAEARQVTEQMLDLGIDQIGVSMAVGPEIRSGRTLPILSLEQLQTIVETAHAHNRPVIAQAIFADEMETVLEAGVDQIVNWPHLDEPMSEEMIAALVSHSVPLLSGFAVEKPIDGDVRRFLDAGGTLVYGTFAPNAGPLNAPYNEFLRMGLVGDMSPMEIIVASTADAADAVGLGDQIGTLEVGKTADIIIVDGNPLEDLRVFREGVTAVIKGGELVPVE